MKLSDELSEQFRIILPKGNQRTRGQWLIHVIHGTKHGPLARYVKLRAAYAPGMPGTFSPPPRDSGSRHASRHVREARAVMHNEIVNYLFPLKLVAEKTFPAFPAHAQPAILRIWQEAHVWCRGLRGLTTDPLYVDSPLAKLF